MHTGHRETLALVTPCAPHVRLSHHVCHTYTCMMAPMYKGCSKVDAVILLYDVLRHGYECESRCYTSSASHCWACFCCDVVLFVAPTGVSCKPTFRMTQISNTGKTSQFLAYDELLGEAVTSETLTNTPCTCYILFHTLKYDKAPTSHRSKCNMFSLL